MSAARELRPRLVALICFTLVAACAKTAPPPARPTPPKAEEPAAPAQTERDDGITMTGTLGTIHEADIAQAFRPRWSEVTRCTQQAQARHHYLTGTIELKFRVGKDGMPSRVFIERSTLGNYEVERCVLEIARAVVFPSPQGGAEAEFSFPIEVRPRASSPYVVAWEEARIAPTLERSRKDVGICRGDPQPIAPQKKGRHAKQEKPMQKIARVELPSNLALTLYIAPGGRVTSAGLSAGGPIDETFATCLMDKTRAWKLDDPQSQIAKITVGVVP